MVEILNKNNMKLHEGFNLEYFELKGKRKCTKCGKEMIMEDGDVAICCDNDKQIKREQALDALLFEKKWWEFWK